VFGSAEDGWVREREEMSGVEDSEGGDSTAGVDGAELNGDTADRIFSLILRNMVTLSIFRQC
jgi:hypothetical protein